MCHSDHTSSIKSLGRHWLDSFCRHPDTRHCSRPGTGRLWGSSVYPCSSPKPGRTKFIYGEAQSSALQSAAATVWCRKIMFIIAIIIIIIITTTTIDITSILSTGYTQNIHRSTHSPQVQPELRHRRHSRQGPPAPVSRRIPPCPPHSSPTSGSRAPWSTPCRARTLTGGRERKCMRMELSDLPNSTVYINFILLASQSTG